MTDVLQTINFATDPDNPVNMFAMPLPGAFDHTWSIFKIDQGFDKTINEGTFGINVPLVDASLRLFASAFAELSATLKLDLGTVGINYSVDVPEAVGPQVTSNFGGGAFADGLPLFQNVTPVWDTQPFTYVGGNLDTHAGNIENNSFQVDFDWAFKAGYDAKLSIDLLFDTFGPHFADSVEGAGSKTLFKLQGNDANLSLNGLLPGLIGSLKVPDPVPDVPKSGQPPTGYDPLATDGPANLPTISKDGDAPNFLDMQLHVIDFVASIFPPLGLLSKTINYADDSYIQWSLFDIIPHFGIQASQNLSFDPSAVLVHISTEIAQDFNNDHVITPDEISAGQELDGVLGDKFNFETPTNGGTLIIHPTYTLVGEYSATVGVKFNGGVTVDILKASIHNTKGPDFDLGFGPLASFEIPAGGFQSDRLDLVTNTVAVPFESQAGDEFSLAFFRNVDGTPQSDNLILIEGGEQTAPIHGAAGNDFIAGNSGDDKTNSGDDHVDRALFGDTGQDTVLGMGGDDEIHGGDGDDHLYGESDGSHDVDENGDLLFGAPGNDTIYGDSGNDVIEGGDGDDKLYGGFGRDEIHGGLGNDLLSTGDSATANAGGIDLLYGEDGDDTLVSMETEATKPDVLDGGDGIDTLIISRSGLITSIDFDVYDTSVVNPGVPGLFPEFTGTLLPDGTLVSNIEILGLFQSGAGDDTIRGGDYDDVILGGAGKDNIDARGGHNIVLGEGGSDRIIVHQDDMPDVVDGGTGIDTLVFFQSDTALGINLDMTLNAQVHPDTSFLFPVGEILSDGTSISQFERLEFHGNNLNQVTDFIVGGAYNDTIHGGAGNDVLAGGAGQDFIYGDDGDDMLITSGGDVVDGGDGYDRLALVQTNVAITFAWQENAVTGATRGQVNGGSRELTITREGGVIALPDGGIARNVEALSFAGRDDQDLDDKIFGSANADALKGGGGDDTLDGGGGGDLISGDAGDDTIYTVDPGADQLSGGADDDLIIIDRGGSSMQFFVDLLGGFQFLPDGTQFDGFERMSIQTGSGNDTLSGGNAQAEFIYVPHFQTVNGLPIILIETVMTRPGDILRGGSGNDRLDGRDGVDFIDGESGDDIIVLSKGASNPNAPGPHGDVIDGGEGYDTLYVDLTRVNISSINLGDPNDLTTLSDGTTIIHVENLEIHGTGPFGGATGPVNFGGGSKNDRLEGTNFSGDQLHGNGGDDLLIGWGGGDVLDGGDGSDTVDYSQAVFAFGPTGIGVTVNLTTGQTSGGDANNDILIDVENIIGTSRFDDTLTGDEHNNRLVGQSGRDELHGLGGDDVLDGGGDPDILDGGTGSDWASYASPDFGTFNLGVVANLLNPELNVGAAKGDTYISIENLEGSRYNDTLLGSNEDNILRGGKGADILRGLGGTDTADYGTADAGVTVRMLQPAHNTGEAAGDKLFSIENLGGSEFDDILFGDNGNNRISGGGGDDVLRGLGGDDTMLGGKGDDTYYVDSPADIVTEALGEGVDTIQTIVNYKLQAGSEIEKLVASLDAPGLILEGNELDNFILGRDNSDVLSGGGGNDRLRGNGGSDAFRLSKDGFATIVDYTAGSDTLQILAAEFGHGLVAGVDAVLVNAKSIANASHSGGNGYFIFDTAGPEARTLFWDSTGGSGSDAVAIAKLTGISTLSFHDIHIV